MNLFIFLLQVLATYRVSRLITSESGPFDTIMNLRRFFGRLAAGSKLFRSIADLFNCQFCMGVWIALFFALTTNTNIPWYLSWFSIAGGQALIAEFVLWINGGEV